MSKKGKGRIPDIFAITNGVSNNDLRKVLMKAHTYKIDFHKQKRESPHNTILHEAILAKNEDRAILFLQAMNYYNIQNEYGETPLHLAVKQDLEKICQVLVNNGADVNIFDNHGKTPLDYALKNKSKKIVDLLHGHGAYSSSTTQKRKPHKPDIFSITNRLSNDDFIEVMNKLDSKKIDFNKKKRKTGNTILHEAILANNQERVLLILLYDVYVNIKNACVRFLSLLTRM